MTITQGRPDNSHGRNENELQVYDLLDRLKIPYLHADHEPAMTMEICAGIDKLLDTSICKNLMLCNRQCTQFYLLLTPGDKIFKTKDLSHQIGSSRLSFAPAEYMQKLLGCTPGSASIFGLMNDTGGQVQLLIDADVLKGDTIGFHPCINTSTLRLSVRDLTDSIIPALGHTPQMVTL